MATTSFQESSLDLNKVITRERYLYGTILYLFKVALTRSMSWLKVSPFDTSRSILWKTHRSSTMRMLAVTSHTSTIGDFSLVVILLTQKPPYVLSSNCHAQKETNLQSSFSRQSSLTRQLQCMQFGSARGKGTCSTRISLLTGEGVSKVVEQSCSSHFVETKKTGTQGMEQQPSLLAFPKSFQNYHRIFCLLWLATTNAGILLKQSTYFQICQEWFSPGKILLYSLSSAWKSLPANFKATTRNKHYLDDLFYLWLRLAMILLSDLDMSSAGQQRQLLLLGMVRYEDKPFARKLRCSFFKS